MPCIELAGLSEAQRRAYILADDELARYAGWDEALLDHQLESRRLLDREIGGLDAV